MEQTVDVFKTLVSEGVGGLWRWIKDRVGDLEDLVLGSIKTFIIEKVIKAGVVWLIAFLNPAAAFIKACKMIVDVITFLIERGSEIMAFVNSILDSVGAIAKGAIGVVAEKVESSLAKALPLAISFLASLLGLGGISEKIHQVIDKVRAPINKAVDFVVMGAVKGFRKLFGKAKSKLKGAKDWVKGKAKKAFQAGLPEDPNERLQAGKSAALAAVRKFSGRRVGAQVLRPLLGGIKLRYGFERLDVVPRAGEWAVTGKINPEFDEPSGVLTPEDLTPGADDGRTLEVGGGNFSFAVSVASKTMLGSRLVATNFEVSDRKTLKKTKKEQERDAITRQNMSILASMGVEVVEQVDATDPASYPEGEFDIVVFNHPYVSGKTADGKPTRGGEGENRKMLAGFLETAKGKIREGGKIMIISSRFRLARWQLDKIAESLNLDMLVKEFNPEEWEGYEHEKTRNADAAETVRRTEQFAIILTVKAEKKDA